MSNRLRKIGPLGKKIIINGIAKLGCAGLLPSWTEEELEDNLSSYSKELASLLREVWEIVQADETSKQFLLDRVIHGRKVPLPKKPASLDEEVAGSIIHGATAFYPNVNGHDFSFRKLVSAPALFESYNLQIGVNKERQGIVRFVINEDGYSINEAVGFALQIDNIFSSWPGEVYTHKGENEYGLKTKNFILPHRCDVGVGISALLGRLLPNNHSAHPDIEKIVSNLKMVPGFENLSERD